MAFNGQKFEWIRYVPKKENETDFQYMGPNDELIARCDSLKDLGVLLSCNLSFSLQIEKAINGANRMLGWGLRTFRSRGSLLLITILKTLIQPQLDYCNELWSPSDQGSINRIEKIQKKLISCMKDPRLEALSYWDKLKALKLRS